MGVVTERRTPLPNATTNHPGPITKSYYDGAGRRTKMASSANGAHTEWVYGKDMRLVRTYTTVSDDSLQHPDRRLYSSAALDGLGRVRGTARDFPDSAGPEGRYSAQIIDYDASGRVVFRSNPTEMRIVGGTWKPAGDDANGGVWRGTSQEYDWQGRTKRVVNPDGTERLFDYGGCGCAGGEVTTLTDEVGRRQKIYSDALGRRWKTEVLNWGGSVYSAATTKYDALDHVVRVRRYAGAAPPQEPEAEGSGYQTTTMTYDGYGRLQTRHLPGQNAGASTTYSYFSDDALRSSTDARGVKTGFTYNARHLVEGITYDRQGVTSVPTDKGGTTPVSEAAAVSFTYDATGNRVTMADGSGSTTYHYDGLSRLTSEDRQFAGLAGTYTLAYEYTLGGQLKKVTDQAAGASFSYSIDHAGQVSAVNSTGLGASAPLARDMKYRAWGALKGMSYGNGTGVSFAYDARGLVTHYGLSGVTQDGQYGALPHGSDFLYYADGRVRYASDLFTDSLVTGNHRLHDRAYSYDHAGRLREAYSGREANQFITGTASGVEGAFRQSYTYDAFDNLTGRAGRYWATEENASEPFDARGRNAAWEYDPDGRFVSRNEPAPYAMPYQPLRRAYDAAGRVVQTSQTTSRPGPSPNSTQVITTSKVRAVTYDGAGQAVKEVDAGQATYYLRSTILGGQAVTEYDASGARRAKGAWQHGDFYTVMSSQRMKSLVIVEVSCAYHHFIAMNFEIGLESPRELK